MQAEIHSVGVEKTQYVLPPIVNIRLCESSNCYCALVEGEELLPNALLGGTGQWIL